jgi:hypothetical protein
MFRNFCDCEVILIQRAARDGISRTKNESTDSENYSHVNCQYQTGLRPSGDVVHGEELFDTILCGMEKRINQRPARLQAQCASPFKGPSRAGNAKRLTRVLAVFLAGTLAGSTAISATIPNDLPVAARIAAEPNHSHAAVPVSTFESSHADATDAPAPVAAVGQVICQEAEVNPVTGHAECIRPRGAPVDPPPRSAVPCTANNAAGAKRGCPEPQDPSSQAR